MNRSKLPKIARWMTTDAMLGVVGADVLQVEALGHLVVELNRRALPFPADRVGDVEVDLRPVEVAAALVRPCRSRQRCSSAALQLRLGLSPRWRRRRGTRGGRVASFGW